MNLRQVLVDVSPDGGGRVRRRSPSYLAVPSWDAAPGARLSNPESGHEP
jgi:hypothetical protein